jgi:hypothetical protein
MKIKHEKVDVISFLKGQGWEITSDEYDPVNFGNRIIELAGSNSGKAKVVFDRGQVALEFFVYADYFDYVDAQKLAAYLLVHAMSEISPSNLNRLLSSDQFNDLVSPDGISQFVHNYTNWVRETTKNRFKDLF